MIEFSRFTVLILAELLLGLGLVSLVLIGIGVIRKQKIYRAAQQLVARIRIDTAPRSERLRQRLSGVYGYRGEVLEQTLHDLNRLERQLYQNIINGFLKRDLIAFQKIDVDVDSLVLAYQGLEPFTHRADPVSVEKPSDPVDREEMQRLQADNQRLSDELKITMDTMARMISEYAAIFSGAMGGQQDEEDGILPADQDDGLEIGHQREAFQVDDSATAGDSVSASAGGRSCGDDWQSSSETVVDAEDPIGDEVLEVADDFSDLVVNAMSQMNETEPISETRQDSLADELEQVDILPPELDEAGDGEEEANEPGSLEEEWAKLLEDETNATDREEPDLQPKQG